MSDRLLREYLSLVIEKIRSKKVSSGRLGGHFDLKKFKSLDSIDMMKIYAGEFLENIGEGSSRVAFLFSGKYVLKIALNKKGVGQNEAELDVYTNPKSKPIVAKIYSTDDQNRWLIADLVKPLSSKDEFEQLAGVDWNTFSWQVNHKDDGPDSGPLVRNVISMIDNNKLIAGDFTGEAHANPVGQWGKTPDGRLVLLDYGFTEDVWNTHYKKDGPSPKADSGDAVTGKKTAALPRRPAHSDELPTKKRAIASGSVTKPEAGLVRRQPKKADDDLRGAVTKR